ncbi:UDP-2,4-diacetamido-2,4,6-trideoxy-beta-L-altropyranose hydrolase [Lysinibacillus xylanilyticus]|uniref:UDP-2,4-diacetamido-2,4, 6-trideoxy-beta-L-altropyranose hydrolase n=1 Tax=Lysinibacillus xylanilyticus TaxID=582475 RepID=UPI003CFC3007
MDTFIRVDASIEIGTGHVMRCLTFAHQLKKEGMLVAFICRGTEGDCIELIEKQGFHVYKLTNYKGSLWTYVADHWEKDVKETIDVLRQHNVKKLIIDHYSIDIKWEQAARAFTKEIIIIDDLANRQHDCDILLDQNFYLNMETRYKGLVPYATKMLLGPAHVLLREEFMEARGRIKPFNGKVERLFIFFGGSDPTNETEKVLLAIKPIIDQSEILVDVVVGNSNPNRVKIKQLCNKIENAHYHCQIDNIAELMAQADLAIGAGGATILERIFLQLPSIIIVVADNQLQTTLDVCSTGSAKYIGKSKEYTKWNLVSTLNTLMLNSFEVQRMIFECNKIINKR